jgi:hypothetical protein
LSGVKPGIMKTRCLACFILFVAAAVGVWAAPAKAAQAKPVLDKGMESALIVRLVGEPDEISPLKADEGKAETWIYRRKIGQTIHQTANTQAYIPAMVGFDAGGVIIGQALVPQYRLKYVRAYQVTALLMVDGKLQLGRQWVTQDEQFAD